MTTLGVELDASNGWRLSRGPGVSPTPDHAAAQIVELDDFRDRDAPGPDPHTDPDSDLETALVAAREGDEVGFAALWRDLHPRLLRYLRVRGDDGAEDLAAETWMHVVKGLATFEGGVAEFRAWLFTIARHRAIDQGRARARGLSVVSVADPGEAAGPETTAPSAEDDVVQNEATAAALRLVATLPPGQAEMVMLRVVAGLDVADVARLLDKRPGAVRVGVHRALKTLSRRAGHGPEGGEE